MSWTTAARGSRSRWGCKADRSRDEIGGVVNNWSCEAGADRLFVTRMSHRVSGILAFCFAIKNGSKKCEKQGIMSLKLRIYRIFNRLSGKTSALNRGEHLHNMSVNTDLPPAVTRSRHRTRPPVDFNLPECKRRSENRPRHAVRAGD